MGNKAGMTPQPEPVLVPPLASGSGTAFEEQLLGMGYALAASAVATEDWQLKEEVQDTLGLATYFRGKIGEPKRVILIGTSLGGLASLRLVEEFPRAFSGAIATCSPASGMTRKMDRLLDFSLAYEAAFGWPTEWGNAGDILAGLGVNADELLLKLNTRAKVCACPRGRASAERFGDVRGMLRRPVITMHTIHDTVAEVDHEGTYASMVEASGCAAFLAQSYVKAVGHCAFTAQQFLTALAELEKWIETGVKADPSTGHVGQPLPDGRGSESTNLSRVSSAGGDQKR